MASNSNGNWFPASNGTAPSKAAPTVKAEPASANFVLNRRTYMYAKFPWGKVLDRMSYDFDGQKFEVTKFYGHKFDEKGHSVMDPVRLNSQLIDESVVLYHCDEISQSAESLFGLLIAWITYKQLGLNNGALVAGIARALLLKG